MRKRSRLTAVMQTVERRKSVLCCCDGLGKKMERNTDEYL